MSSRWNCPLPRVRQREAANPIPHTLAPLLSVRKRERGCRYAAILLIPCTLALGMSGGCAGGGDAEQIVAAAARSVQTAFEAWQRGEKAAALKAGKPPIEFYDDDWERSARLVEFKIVKSYLETDGTPRCAVQFIVQYGKKPPENRQATYQVVTKGEVIVAARDPFS